MRLPIDTAEMTFLCAIAPAPVVDFETRRQRADENGEPLYGLQLVALTGDGAEVLKVTVAGEPGGLSQGKPVKVAGLVANYWQMNDRSGVSFRAARVEALTAPNASGSSSSSSSSQAAAKAS